MGKCEIYKTLQIPPLIIVVFNQILCMVVYVYYFSIAVTEYLRQTRIENFQSTEIVAIVTGDFPNTLSVPF